MKQYLFLATAIATASLFTGCSNNEYVGDQPEAFNGTDGAIAFSMGKANTTRVEEKTGDDAAKMLNKVFYVYGTKGDTHTEVFRNYKVEYVSDNKDKTSDNFKGWEYVGKFLTVENLTPNIGKGENFKQTIKYWDYNASKYQFYAFSADKTDFSNSKITVEKVQNDKAYTVDIKAGADIGKLYFADYVEISKGTPSTPVQQNAENTYGGYVKFTFRNLAAKVRVGFYETVPGYKIKIDQMSAGANGSQTVKTDKFFADCPNTEASQNSKITVTYITEEGETKNRAFVSAKNNAVNTTQSLDAKSELTLGGGVFHDPLATTSSSPTWDTTNGAYTFFWPQTGNDEPLKINVDYTLTSTDNSGEKIEVKGATATVPKEYVQWAANTAYTYIFKISDNTNGTTGSGSDPAGLYPITFDAVVEDYANEGSITTVSTPSVTASQDGVTFVSPGNGIMFKINEPITLKVMNGGIDVTSSATITGGYITGNYDYGKTPEQNLTDGRTDDRVIIENANIWTNDKKLTATTTAGYWVLKVTAGNSTTYVIIRVDSAEEGPANPANQ